MGIKEPGGGAGPVGVNSSHADRFLCPENFPIRARNVRSVRVVDDLPGASFPRAVRDTAKLPADRRGQFPMSLLFVRYSQLAGDPTPGVPYRSIAGCELARAVDGRAYAKCW